MAKNYVIQSLLGGKYFVGYQTNLSSWTADINVAKKFFYKEDAEMQIENEDELNGYFTILTVYSK